MQLWFEAELQFRCFLAKQSEQLVRNQTTSKGVRVAVVITDPQGGRRPVFVHAGQVHLDESSFSCCSEQGAPTCVVVMQCDPDQRILPPFAALPMLWAREKPSCA